MKRKLARFVVIAGMVAFLASFALLLTGCASSTGQPLSPTIQLAEAEDFFATTENLLVDAQLAGVIPAQEKPAIILARNTARDALRQAEADVTTNPPQFQEALNKFNAVTPDLMKWRDLYVKKATP